MGRMETTTPVGEMGPYGRREVVKREEAVKIKGTHRPDRGIMFFAALQ